MHGNACCVCRQRGTTHFNLKSAIAVISRGRRTGDGDSVAAFIHWQQRNMSILFKFCVAYTMYVKYSNESARQPWNWINSWIEKFECCALQGKPFSLLPVAYACITIEIYWLIAYFNILLHWFGTEVGGIAQPRSIWYPLSLAHTVNKLCVCVWWDFLN